MVAELLLLNRENSYVMFNWWQLVNYDIYQKSANKIEFSENHIDKFSAFSALRLKKTLILSEYWFRRMCREVVTFGSKDFK